MTTAAPARPVDGDQVARWETDGGHLREPAVGERRAQRGHVARQLTAVADRLCREFAPNGGTAAAAVREQVHRSRAEFGSPRVISYLPILVERDVRRRLRSGRRDLITAGPAGPGPDGPEDPYAVRATGGPSDPWPYPSPASPSRSSF